MKWEPDNFELQTTSIWNFPEHGSWATHNSSYRGNWSPYVPRNLLLRYTNPGDYVLDQFAGGGTTLIEAKLLGRNGIGTDINPVSVKLCVEKCSFDMQNQGNVCLQQADARNLAFIGSETMDFICTHPPYANIIEYSKIAGDLSDMELTDYLDGMSLVARESYRVLKKFHFCSVLIGDMRKNGLIIPLGFEVMNIFLNAGFSLKEIIIKQQHNCSKTEFWRRRSQQYNFLLIAHEYLYVFKK